MRISVAKANPLFTFASFQSPLAPIKVGLLTLVLLGLSSLFFFFQTHASHFRVYVLNQRPRVFPEGHFFETETSFSITSPVAGDVRYTLDGRTPTATDSALREGEAITLSSPAVIRYGLFQDTELSSPIYTHPVFIGTNHEVPVVSLVTDPENLWDSKMGIYTQENYTNSGKEWERPAQVLYFTKNGEPAFEREIGVRLHGGGSRALAQKSWRLIFREGAPLTYPVFEGLEYHSYQTLILRNAGADAKSAFMRDVLAHRLADQATDLETQASQPVAVYLNDEYWGLYHLRERQNQEYLSQHYGLPPGDLNIIEVPHDRSDLRGQTIAYKGTTSAEDARRFNDLLAELQACDTCFDYGDFERSIDVQNALDYLILQIHTSNYDWPYGNFRVWRYDTPTPKLGLPAGQDGRFRFLLFDLDVGFGFGSTSSARIQKVAQRSMYGQLIDNKFPMRTAFFDDRFLYEYLMRYADLLNTVFRPDNVQRTIKEIADEMRPEMPAHIHRWGGIEDVFGNAVPATVEQWEQEVALLMEYAELRSDAMFENTVEQFQLEGTYIALIDVQPAGAGQIQVNTLDPFSDFPWTGRYFAGAPLILSVSESSGYTFSHWDGLPSEYQEKKNDKSIRLEQNNDLRLNAVFSVE